MSKFKHLGYIAFILIALFIFVRGIFATVEVWDDQSTGEAIYITVGLCAALGAVIGLCILYKSEYDANK
jgi:hypothetical protein